jgi:hypothetical protein
LVDLIFLGGKPMVLEVYVVLRLGFTNIDSVDAENLISHVNWRVVDANPGS